MMYTTPRMKKLYSEIQEKLSYMIPEKWDKIYLYASVTEGLNNLETGEMYFYYFPKGILKKDPVNVYEVPNKFNIDDSKYFKLADELYGTIKKLRKEYINMNDNSWSNIIISIENFKFKVEYGFEDFKNSQYNSYDRHIIFRYMYLNTSINTYNKKERAMLEGYVQGMHLNKEKKQIYWEPIYRIEQNNIIDYQKENEDVLVENKAKTNDTHYSYEIKNDYEKKITKTRNHPNFYNYMKKDTNDINNTVMLENKMKIEDSIELQVKQTLEETKQEHKNQILNFDKFN